MPNYQHRIKPGFTYLGIALGRGPSGKKNFSELEVYANLDKRLWAYANETEYGPWYAEWDSENGNPGLYQDFFDNCCKLLKPFFDGDISISPNSKCV